MLVSGVQIMCDWKARLFLRSRYGGEVDKESF